VQLHSTFEKTKSGAHASLALNFQFNGGCFCKFQKGVMIEFAAIPLDYYLLSQFFFLSFFFRVTGSFSVYQLLFFLEKIIHPLLID
jgi:hypothetical protein